MDYVLRKIKMNKTNISWKLFNELRIGREYKIQYKYEKFQTKGFSVVQKTVLIDKTKHLLVFKANNYNITFNIADLVQKDVKIIRARSKAYYEKNEN